MQHKAWKKKNQAKMRDFLVGVFGLFFKSLKGGELRFLEGLQPPNLATLRLAHLVTPTGLAGVFLRMVSAK